MKHARRLGATIGAAGLGLALALAGGPVPAAAQETRSPKPYVALEDLPGSTLASASGKKPTATTLPAATDYTDPLDVPTPVKTQAPATTTAARADSNSGDSSVHHKIRELWTENARPLQATEASRDLQLRVEALQALQATTKPARPQAGPAAISLQERPLAAVLSAQSQPAISTTQPAAATRPALDPAVLERLKKAPADGPAGAVALADALFRDGHVEPAGVLYQSALATNLPAGQKDWALFQLGNCRAEQDPPAALEAYQRLAKECPDSPWAAAGAAQVRWIEWRQTHIAPSAPQRQPTTAVAAKRPESR